MRSAVCFLQLKTRAVTLGRYISSEEEIQEAALKLLRAELPVEVRLMGLRMSSFYQPVPEPGQKSLQTFLKGPSPGETLLHPMRPYLCDIRLWLACLLEDSSRFEMQY